MFFFVCGKVRSNLENECFWPKYSVDMTTDEKLEKESQKIKYPIEPACYRKSNLLFSTLVFKTRCWSWVTSKDFVVLAKPMLLKLSKLTHWYSFKLLIWTPKSLYFSFILTFRHHWTKNKKQRTAKTIVSHFILRLNLGICKSNDLDRKKCPILLRILVIAKYRFRNGAWWFAW